MVEIEVKQLEDAIKRDFLGRKVVVIEQDELDYIDRLGDYHRDNQMDVWRLSSLCIEGVNGHLVGALKQEVMKGELEGNQAGPRSSCLEEPSKEVKYLKKEVRSKHESIESSEVELLKKVVDVRRKIKPKEW